MKKTITRTQIRIVILSYILFIGLSVILINVIQK